MGGWTAAVIRDKASIKETLAQTQAKRSGPIDAGKFLDGICEAISGMGTRQASATMVDGHEVMGTGPIPHSRRLVPPPWCPAASH
jgi:hypothetical protein